MPGGSELGASKGTKRLAAGRLTGQQLARHDFATPGELVAWMGAVQAQEWAASKWAVGLRLPEGATDESIERAVDEGEIVRIHALRWTWQLVAPGDVRWILALVAPRLVEKAARRHRELELDAPTIRRSNAAIAGALRDGAHMTRAELAGVLERKGVSAAGQRLPHLLALAELAQLIGSGRRKGKHPTWALLDDRVPSGKPLDCLEALAELARRYFRSRGPATVDDFQWWSGVSPSDARAAVAAIEHTLVSENFDGRAHWRDASRDGPPASPAKTHLLPAFDEYLVAYRNRDAVLAPAHAKLHNPGGGILGPCVVHGGRVVGTWRRTLGTSRATVSVTVSPFPRAGGSAEARPSERETERAIDRYAAFLRRTRT